MFAAAAFALMLVSTPDLTFVRHAETIANATGRYSSKTIDTFSEKGKRQVSLLTKTLAGQRFDLILVSPSPRAMNTIAPYLRQTHQKALIWPLLYECCTGHRPPDAHATKFGYGAKIKIPATQSDIFRLIEGDSRFPASGDYNAGLAQVRAAIAKFSDRYTGFKMLMVGHSGMGGQFLHSLSGKWIEIKNATPIHLPSRP